MKKTWRLIFGVMVLLVFGCGCDAMMEYAFLSNATLQTFALNGLVSIISTLAPMFHV